MKSFKATSFLLALLMVTSFIIPCAYAFDGDEGIAPHTELCQKCRQAEVKLFQNAVHTYFLSCPADNSAFHEIQLRGDLWFCPLCGEYSGALKITSTKIKCSIGIHTNYVDV